MARIYEVTKPSLLVDALELTEEELASLKRPDKPTLPIAERFKSFKEVDLGLDEKMAMNEARRCLRCELEPEEID